MKKAEAMETALKTSVALAHCHVGCYGRGEYSATLAHPREYGGELVAFFKHGKPAKVARKGVYRGHRGPATAAEDTRLPRLSKIRLDKLRVGTRRHDRWSAQPTGSTIDELRGRGVSRQEIEYLIGRGVVDFDPPLEGV